MSSFTEVNRVSPITGELHSIILPISVEQLLRYEMGEGSASDIFTNLNQDELKYIESGITPSDLPDCLVDD